MNSKLKTLIGGLFIGISLLVSVEAGNGQSELASVTLDKTEYKEGEALNLTLTNNSDKSIWYWAENKCGTHSADTAMRAVEGEMNSVWFLYFPAQCLQEEVRPIYRELNPKETVVLKFEWNEFLTGPVRGGFPSRYKIVMMVYKEEPKEIGFPEIKIYSNIFIINAK